MSQKRHKKLRKIARVTGTLGLSLVAGAPVLAQEARSLSETNQPVQLRPMIVTGSLIPTAETVGVAPVETFRSEDIERSGAQDVLTVLRKLSTSFAGVGNLGQTLNNGGYGEANIAIRNLPTLVLLDGKRLAGSPFSALFNAGNSVDLNLIPISMIERIEVLKDGASTLYGSDAIGGVVNIIPKKNWNGAEVSGRYGFSGTSNVTEQRASVMAGASTENTSFTGGAQYYHMDPLLAKQRHIASEGILDLAAQGLNPPSYVSPSYPGRVGSFILAGSPLAKGAPGYDPTITTPIVDGKPYATLADYNTAHPGVYLPLSSTPLGAGLTAAGVGNFPLLNTTDFGSVSIQEQNRRSALANGEQRVFEDKLKLFGSFLYANTESLGGLAPSPAPSLAISGITVPANNPFNPFGRDLGAGASGTPRVRSRFVEFGNRIFDSVTDYYQFVGGVKGDFDNGYSYEAAYTYNKSSQTQFTKNAVNGAGLNLAQTPDLSADPTGHLSKLTDANGNALPTYNVFGLPGSNDPRTINALRTTLFNGGTAEEWGINGVINGAPFELPAGQFQFAVGAEYRYEHLSLFTDGLTQLGLVPGLSAARPFPGGQRDEAAGFGEISIPIFSEKWNFPGFYSFEINASGRHEEFNPGGDSTVPKVGFKWQPIDKQLTVRGNYSEGYITPTLYNLFGPARISNPTIFVQGVSGQIQTYLPSNVNLPPATSKNYSGGIVYTPKQLPNLTVSVDYYRVEFEGLPFNPDAGQRVASLNALGSASPYAGDFVFSDLTTKLTKTDPNQVTLANFGQITIPTLPGGSQSTDGIDLSAAYSIPTDQYGKFSVWGNANVLLSYYVQNGPTSGRFQYAGYYTDPQVVAGFQGLLPDYAITTGFDWAYGGFGTSVSARYIPSVKDPGDLFPAVGATSNSHTASGGPWKIDSYYTIDLQMSYEFGKGSTTKNWYNKTRVTVGVNNITDNLAPLIASSSEDNTDKSSYDILGRFFYFELSKKF